VIYGSYGKPVVLFILTVQWVYIIYKRLPFVILCVATFMQGCCQWLFLRSVIWPVESKKRQAVLKKCQGLSENFGVIAYGQ